MHPLELAERMESLPHNATKMPKVLVAPAYIATVWLNDLHNNEQYAHNGGEAANDGARVLFAEDVSWNEEPSEGEEHLQKVTIERLRFLLGTACASIATELRDGPFTIVERSEFRIREEQ